MANISSGNGLLANKKLYDLIQVHFERPKGYGNR